MAEGINKINFGTDEEVFQLNLLKDKGIIIEKAVCTSKECSKKGKIMKLVKRKRDKNSDKTLFSYRCTGDCCTYKSVFTESFFSLFKTPFMWLHQLKDHQ